MMNKVFKIYFSVLIALLFGMQATLLHHNSHRPAKCTSSPVEKLSLAEVSADEYTKSSSFIIEGDSQVFTQSLTFKFALPDLFYSKEFILKFIELSLKRQINLSKQVDLDFGIREIIFPSHFFW
ncbi:hypothetical protein [Pararhodonellum marinum]|uniref:hypothetical protein n=1 Tax=Pararhodonellum marinum TaxID=2755358 RepID=UPI001890B3F7|nr:hypothetical protein [Pararhodonellum marinum]